MSFLFYRDFSENILMRNHKITGCDHRKLRLLQNIVDGFSKDLLILTLNSCSWHQSWPLHHNFILNSFHCILFFQDEPMLSLLPRMSFTQSLEFVRISLPLMLSERAYRIKIENTETKCLCVPNVY